MKVYLNQQNSPYVQLEINLSSWMPTDCLIDTGFSGGICLPEKYLQKLRNFINGKITERLITEDLNPLLPQEKFQKIRKILKTEVLLFLAEEIKRLEEPI